MKGSDVKQEWLSKLKLPLSMSQSRAYSHLVRHCRQRPCSLDWLLCLDHHNMSRTLFPGEKSLLLKSEDRQMATGQAELKSEAVLRFHKLQRLPEATERLISDQEFKSFYSTKL